MAHVVAQHPTIRQRLGLLFISLLIGLWLSLDEALCQHAGNVENTSFCYNTGSGWTCFQAVLAINTYPTSQSFEAVIIWCNSAVPRSTLITINSLESQGTVKIFIELANHSIVLDAPTQLSANVSLEWSWIKRPIPTDVVGLDQSNDEARGKQKNVEPLVGCVYQLQSQHSYNCEYTDVTMTHTRRKMDDSNEPSNNQCICPSPQNAKIVFDATYSGKWQSCNCSKQFSIVCHREEERASSAEITDEMSSSRSAYLKSSQSISGSAGKTDSTSAVSQKPSTHASAALTSSSPSPSTGQFTSHSTKAILPIFLLFVAVAFVVIFVVLIIRKRKYDGRNGRSFTKDTKQSEAVAPGYEAMVQDMRPAGDIVPIYTVLELTEQPPPSSNTIYASVQPTSETVDMGKTVDYVDIDLPRISQHKPRSVNQITACLSPDYSEPFEAHTSASNTEYAEPFQPDKTSTANAPVLPHNADGDQQTIYSLATAISLDDPTVISSEPNKPTKPSTPTGEAVKAIDPIYLEAIEVKHGEKTGFDATQDPNAVYAGLIKLKKSV